MPFNSQLNIQSNTPKDHTQHFLDTLVSYIDKTHNPTVEFSLKPRKETDNKRKSLTDTKNEIKKYRNRTRNSDTQNRNNEIQHRTSDIQHRTSDIQRRTRNSDTQNRTRNSDMQIRNNDVQHKTSDIQKRTRNSDIQSKTNDINSRTSDIENQRNHSYTAINCQENKTSEIHPISLQNPILETETYKLDKNNELLNYLRQKASKNTIYDKSNIQTNSPRKDTITLKAFVTEYCRNNDLERPEYLIEKQNDVYICKADFVGLSFSSKYHFEKQNAMEEVCKIIVDYLMENKERKKKKVMLKDLLA